MCILNSIYYICLANFSYTGTTFPLSTAAWRSAAADSARSTGSHRDQVGTLNVLNGVKFK